MLRLQELRNTAGLTQQALAEKIGVKNYIVANWEQGRTEPSVKDLIDIANFFECSIDYLLERENDYGQIVIFNQLSKEQGNLLLLFDKLTEEQKHIVSSLLKELSATSK